MIPSNERKEFVKRLKHDPVLHVKKVQGVETLEPFQERLLRAIEEHERVAIRSCHDMGKTWTMAKAVLWFLSTHPGAKVVTTAPTARQVKLLLWSEIRAGHAKSKYPLGGELGVQEWKIAPDWWAVGFTTQKQASSGEGQANSGFQGIHGEWVFVVFDEATGIAVDIWKQLEGLLTSHQVKFVAIGNPTSKSSEFYRCFSDPSIKKLHLSCFDSPNLVANDITNIEELQDELDRLKEMEEDERLSALSAYKVIAPKLLTTRWVMGMALKLGVDHPLFVSKCLGEFPNEDERCLMPLGIVESAQQREKPKSIKGCKVCIGVDPARFGSDMSVMTILKGPVITRMKSLSKRATTELAGIVIHAVDELTEEERKDTVVIVDATGIGSGVVDILNETKAKRQDTWRGVQIIELHFGETFKVGRDGNEKRVKELTSEFANKKALMFKLLADDLKDNLCLPEKSDYYSEQLPSIIYSFDSKGRWVIEDKERYKKRTGRGSPDEADSLALANFGRHYNGGVGQFTEDMAKPKGKPMAGRLRGD